nr:VWA domain-containing protein [Oceanococcus sp. HetDA_MAG_MS8]
MYQHFSQSITRLTALALCACTLSLQADDTEVFFPQVDNLTTETARPNILFIMDTSGSMGSTDGTGETRLERVKEALNLVLDEINQNANVGLMRLSDDEGGPVLFPVAPIDSNAEAIEASCALEGVDGNILYTTNLATNNLQDVRLNVLNLLGTFTSQANVETLSMGRGQGVLSLVGLGDDDLANMTVALRFPNIAIPQGATIENAVLELMPGAINAGTATFSIQAEDAGDSAVLTSGTNILSRDLTTEEVIWPADEVGDWLDPFTEILGVTGGGTSQTTPDLAPVIQEVVSRSDWCGSNALTLVLRPRGDTSSVRQFLAGLTNSDVAPTLRIGYNRFLPGSANGCSLTEAVTAVDVRADDAEERLNNGQVLLSSNDLELGRDGRREQLVGLRFNDIQIPQGGTVSEAVLTFTAKNRSSGNSSLRITAENTGDASGFSSSRDSISDRYAGRAPGSVSWNPENWTNRNGTYDSPDISALLQAVVNRPDWQPGNSVVFFIEGSGTRRAFSVDGSNSKAPRLRYRAQGTLEIKTVRTRLKELVNDLTATGFTPVTEVLTEAAHYYRGDEVFFGRTRGSGQFLNDNSNGDGTSGGQDDITSSGRYMRVSHCATYTGGQQEDPDGCNPQDPNDSDCRFQSISGNPQYISPIVDECSSNNIVLLTDGFPNNDTNRQLVRRLAGGTCSGSDCAPELARFLATGDQASGLEGLQSVNTYTIGFANFNTREYLEEIAAAGNGTFSPASNAEDLAERFREIIAEILDKNTTFVAPAVTINTYNRLSHLDQLYFALFRPDVDPHWQGNLKRFRLRANPGQIVDKNENAAVDPNTGFFFDSAFSFWNDSGQADGGNIDKGGAEAEIVAPGQRRLYTNISGSNLTASGNAVDVGNDAISKEVLDLVGEPDERRAEVLNWARGIDVNDDDADGDDTDLRHVIGDPLHSEPVLVTYSEDQINPDITIYMGTNEGFIHAIDGRDGSEIFSFIPKELLPNLTTLQENTGTWASRPYGMDGPLVAVVESPNTPSRKITVVAGMRRGGTSYYALDVSNRDAPRVLWQIKGGSTPGFDELGQTWSTPIPVRVQFGGAVETALLFGAGYDENQDARNSVRRSDAVGRGVFLVRASDGALLWSAGNPEFGPSLAVADMQASVPAAPAAIDLDDDGLMDRFYIADTNAKLFRFDVNPGNSGAGNFATGGLMADLGEDNSIVGNRRFYNQPDVAFVQPGTVEPLLTVSIGSGFRAGPLETSTQDRFYVLFDPDTTVAGRSFFSKGVIDDPDAQLYDATANDLQSASNSEREAAIQELFSKRGAYIDMRAGEKVLTVSRTFDNRVLFGSFQPPSANANVCTAGEGISRLYFMDVIGLTAAADLNDSGGDLTTGDRDKELAHGGIPPNPVILFPDSGEQPVNPIVFVGPESFELPTQVRAEKTFWEEVEPWNN